jgi:hypothetical protein
MPPRRSRQAPSAWAIAGGLSNLTLRDPVSDRTDGPTPGVPLAVVESAPADLLPAGRSAALLSGTESKSASGCADPPWPRARRRRKGREPRQGHNARGRTCSRWGGIETVRLLLKGRRTSSGPGNLACLRSSTTPGCLSTQSEDSLPVVAADGFDRSPRASCYHPWGVAHPALGGHRDNQTHAGRGL